MQGDADGLVQSTAHLRLVPMAIKVADRFVADHHSHSKPTYGKAKAAIGAARGAQLVGVAVLGRPKAKALDDETRLEVVRLCVHGSDDERFNACSFLLGRARRLSVALGYAEPLISYLRFDEDGASYRAAGWRCVAPVKAESWDRRERPRIDPHEIVPRMRWEAQAA